MGNWQHLSLALLKIEASSIMTFVGADRFHHLPEGESGLPVVGEIHECSIYRRRKSSEKGDLKGKNFLLTILR